MGAAKFPEEIIERYIEDSNSADVSQSAPRVRTVSVKPTLKYCPLCYEGYIEESALGNHIASRHGKQHVFLKVNDQVVRDVCWLEGAVKQCKIVVLKVPHVEVKLTFSGHTKSLSISQTTDLSEHLARSSLTGSIGIEIHDPQPRYFRIYQGKQPSFRSDHIDRAAAAMMKELSSGRAVDLTEFRDTCRRHRLNELESRYLDGVVEYCHGLNLEKEGKQSLARLRLESSMNLLVPFRTTLAEDMRHALALRMNCFLGQWGCSTGSPFRIAERFFCLNLRQDQGDDIACRTYRIEIEIDSVSVSTLDALRAYEAGDEEAVLAILASIQTRDRNDEDKMNLIRARTMAKKRNVERAAAAYQSFRDHPIFGKEAAGYLLRNGQV